MRRDPLKFSKPLFGERENIAKFYSDCEIVEYERVEAETQTIQYFMGL